MKMLVSRAYTSANDPFNMAELKDHLRVDFDEDDSAIRTIGRAVASEIEQVTQVALLTQTITVTIFDPGCDVGLSLPIGPVATDTTPTITVDGVAFTAFAFMGGIRPYIRWGDSFFDLTPSRISIEYVAGFGEDMSAVPEDLAQALMDQAALHYDGRSPMNAKSLTTSPHMARIAARYRGVQA
ncbi:phage head-tail connector protein [Ruegeria pomeroyi]|nr:phage head-tail connector protein [Ruegeria pomeroyi]